MGARLLPLLALLKGGHGAVAADDARRDAAPGHLRQDRERVPARPLR